MSAKARGLYGRLFLRSIALHSLNIPWTALTLFMHMAARKRQAQARIQ